MHFSTTSFVKTVSCIVLLSLLVIACKKGDTGPAGGTDPAGPTGTKGSPNVIYSAWVTANSFRDSSIDGSSSKVATVAAPQLADTILSKGTVMVYFTFGSGIFPLPYTGNAGGKISTISFIPGLNKIFITRFTHDNSNSVSLSTSLQYRYIIIIPGGIGGRRMNIDYTTMSYQEVCSLLGIPE